MDKNEQLGNFINESKKICVFSGAGISCPSGIPDFRSADGLYNQSSGTNFSPEEIISHHFFTQHTNEFYRFYKSKMIFPNAKPNKAHSFFAEMEKYKDVSIVTQNIDGLHQLAGSTSVMELHGSVHRNYCVDCNYFYSLDYMLSTDDYRCPRCGGTIKPDVVLYEESLDNDTIMRAIKAISQADCLIIVGTSLSVYPAASFVRYYKGNKLVLINKQETGFDREADLVFNEDIIKTINNIDKFINKEEKR